MRWSRDAVVSRRLAATRHAQGAVRGVGDVDGMSVRWQVGASAVELGRECLVASRPVGVSCASVARMWALVGGARADDDGGSV